MKLLSGLIGSGFSILSTILILIALAKIIVNMWQMPVVVLVLFGIITFLAGQLFEALSGKVTEAKEVD